MYNAGVMWLKETLPTVIASLALHGALGAVAFVGYQPLSQQDLFDRGFQSPVTISYVRVPEKTAVSSPKQSKKIKHPRPVKNSLKLNEKSLPKKIQAQEIVNDAPLTKASSNPKAEKVIPKITPNSQEITRGSAELLADPVKGRVFSGYFGFVKAKIHRSLEHERAVQDKGLGRVTLYFVLNSQGNLEAVSVLDEESNADDNAKTLAKECLIKAAPFARFPKDLSLSRIAFNVTVYFQDF